MALTVGGVFTTGVGAGAGGVGDLLEVLLEVGGVGVPGAVSVVEYDDRGVGAVSVLDEYLALGTVPKVEGLGDDGVVLGLDEEVVDEGSLALAEVLALGGLTVIAAGCIAVGAGGCAGGRVIVLVGAGWL